MEVKVHSHARFANDTGIKWMSQLCATLMSKSFENVKGKKTLR